MPASPDAAVDVRGVSKTFGDASVLHDLTLRLAPGEVVALLGPNGAGKTTTLRILAGLIAPTSGDGSVAGVALGGSLQRLRSRVGLLTEVPGLWERLSVRANLLTYARLYGVTAASGRVDGLLERLGLAARASDRAGVLSKGQRQRLALARALVADPPVLLLDEPTSGLDPAAARTVRDVVSRGSRARRGGSAVHAPARRGGVTGRSNRRPATHTAGRRHPGRAADTPGRAGRVAVTLDGRADDFREALAGIAASVDTAGARLEVTLAAGRDVADAVAALTAAGARVRAVRETGPSLEAAYLSLVRRDG